MSHGTCGRKNVTGYVGVCTAVFSVLFWRDIAVDEIISEYGGVIMLLAVGKIVVESLVRILGIVTGM